MKIVQLFMLCFFMCSCTNNQQNQSSLPQKDIKYNYMYLADSLKTTIRTASSRYLFLVDYSIPSNKPRFLVWDYSQNKIILSLWCAHGYGGGSTAEKPVFSNTPGTNCSSVGLFSVDKTQGRSSHYGYLYHAVDGKDSTNSNARARQLLIHPWSSVTSDSIRKISTPMDCDYRSAGCFTLTKYGYQAIHNIISSENKRILLYSFY